MNVFMLMIVTAIGLAGAGLLALIWAVKSGQFDDPTGAAVRVLSDDDRPS